MDTDIFIQNIGEINTKLESGKAFVDPELLAEFANRYNNLAENIEKIKTEERNLRIGIVGAVKAGKSTFLNALLFDGKEVLPKAPTPMTAALTRVCYSDIPSAKIVFYSTQEWKKIEKKAKEYKSRIDKWLEEEEQDYMRRMAVVAGEGGYICPSERPSFESVEAKHKSEMPIDICSCYELVQMLDTDILIEDYLEQGEIAIHDTTDFNQELNKYVGADGQYTPIVKYTELSLVNPLLQDLEIVDTPGLNDPILSRSKKTQDFLMQCDVVFVLSYAGQFLTNEDMALIRNVLPAEGIRHAVIVASKFDSGILDFRKRGATFKAAFSGTRKNLKNSAQSQKEQMGRSGVALSIVKCLQEENILCASGLLFGIAKKIEKGEQLDEEESHIIKAFQKRFDDFDASVNGLYELSGMENIRKKVLNKLRGEKKQIVRERTMTFLSSQQSRFSKLLEDINVDLRKSLKDIDQYDYKELQEKSKKLRNNLDAIRESIKAKFSDAADKAEKQMQEIIAQVHEEMENHRAIAIGSTVKTKKETLHSGLFGVLKQELRVTTNIKITSVDEVVKNIDQYCERAHRIVINQFQNIIDVEGLKRDVKENIQHAFDMSDKDFDPEEIANTLDGALAKLTIPEISWKAEKYTDKMLANFPETGSVEGESNIAELKMQQSLVLQDMFTDMKEELSKKSAEWSDMLNKYAGKFVDDVEKKLSSSIKRLQELMADKETNIREMNMYMETVSECKQILRGMEVSNGSVG